jgi:Tfp pilus assembly protein PilF
MFIGNPTLIQRALQHFQRNELEPAAQLLQKALAAQPRDGAALHMLGVIRARTGQLDEAISLLRKALSVSKNDASLQYNLARALSDSGRDQEALPHLRKAIQLAPKYTEAWLNLGHALQRLDDLEAALKAYDEAIRLAPDFAHAWNNKGLLMRLCNRPGEAIACYEKALSIHPGLAEVHCNRGVALADLGRDAEAMSAYREAIRISPDYLEARRCIAKLKLKSGQFQEVWEDFELRWQQPESTLPPFASTKPWWQGQASAHPLLLWGEQGIGDQILYASILPELSKLPQKKMLALDARLLPLFARSMPGFELLALDAVSDDMPFAEHLPLGSLPRHYRNTSQSFAAARAPYLFAAPQRSAELREKILQRDKLVCGVTWNSNRKHYGQSKSLSLQNMLSPLAELPLHFVNLQYGDTAAERQHLQQSLGITVQNIDEVDNFNDIDGLAALIQACDVVLTTSNSTAHLAGALGKDTLLLLPLSRFWYWSEVDGHNPWYPSIKLFMQRSHGDWQQPLEEVRQHIQQIDAA